MMIFHCKIELMMHSLVLSWMVLYGTNKVGALGGHLFTLADLSITSFSGILFIQNKKQMILNLLKGCLNEVCMVQLARVSVYNANRMLRVYALTGSHGMQDRKIIVALDLRCRPCLLSF